MAMMSARRERKLLLSATANDARTFYFTELGVAELEGAAQAERTQTTVHTSTTTRATCADCLRRSTHITLPLPFFFLTLSFSSATFATNPAQHAIQHLLSYSCNTCALTGTCITRTLSSSASRPRTTSRLLASRGGRHTVGGVHWLEESESCHCPGCPGAVFLLHNPARS
jgi:hypothetical protein